MNTHIVRCYYKSIKTTPDTYRKAMYDLWKVEYNHTPFTEQRICDQRRIIFQKAENANNQQLRGNWLTNFEIQRIEND